MVFIKYILKYSKDRDEYPVHLWIALQNLREHWLHGKYKKHKYWLEAMVFLEHMAPKDEIKVNLQKVKAITKCRRSTNALRLEIVWVQQGIIELRKDLSNIIFPNQFFEASYKVSKKI